MKQTLHALLLALLFAIPLSAQETKKDIIAKALADYFLLERENIHVQLNKSIYTNDEKVWFKGYVFHRRKNVPFFSSVNIFASIMDDTGKILETKLLYGNIGSFTGDFALGSNYKSGTYYLQFYTNWMNNFSEDESAVYEITVINKETGAGNALAKADPSKLKVQLNPEGGSLVEGVPNVVGIAVSDCNGNPLNVTTAIIEDANGKAVLQVQLNKKGYGRFELPAGAVGYKAVVSHENARFEQSVPAGAQKGIALQVSNYTIPGKTVVDIKANKLAALALTGKPVYLLLHRDDKAMLYEIALSESSPTAKMAIANEDLAEGLNTLRVLDSDLNQLAERLVYNYPSETISGELKFEGKTRDSLRLSGKTGYPNMNVSVSILPENTISLDEQNDIYGSFLITPYIKTARKVSGRYYLGALSKVKKYELDLFLLNQKSKYEWKNILSSPPKDTYPFDMGLKVKGTVPKSGGDTKFARVRMYSLTNAIDLIADVNENREFEFDNLLIADSAHVNFTLLRKGEKPKELTLAPQVLNGVRKFNKPYVPRPKCYAPIGVSNGPDVTNVYKEAIQLDEVKIEGKKLKYANSFGNGNLRGYKISDSQTYMYQSLLNYIKTYGGFNVVDSNGQIRILSRTVNTINGGSSGPIVYIDNIQQQDLAILSMIQLSEVDEIYMSAHAIVPSIRNYMGIIRIYLKKGARVGSKNTTPDILIRSGFEKVIPFENIVYNSTDDKGFENFGVIGWEPQIMTDETGAYKFFVPKTGQKSLKVLIEGFSADGKLLSELRTIAVDK